jgi:3-oxoadipate enol-lactonase/4-carboxymuconolactone decarboxylase
MPIRVLHHEIDGVLNAGQAPSGAAAGAAAPPPLLLGSSIGTSGAMWAAAAPALARDGRAVVRWDLPGHGASSADLLPEGAAAVADFAALVLELADSLGIARFDYAGDSFSGAVGTWLALHHPDRVNALAVLCSSAHFGDPAGWLARARMVRDDGAAALAQLAETAPDRWFPAGAPIRTSVAAAGLERVHRAVDPGAYAACCEAIAALDLGGELGRITVPTLVIAGRDDRATPPSHARELVDGIPGSSLIELAGVGHLAPIEAPEHVAAALHAHFAEHAPARAGDRSVGHAAEPRDGSDPSTAAARHTAGMAVRRAVLGDAHVDRAVAGTTPFTAPFQDLITRYAWGEIWTRPGLDRKTRSCITLTALVAHGHLDELAMHVRAARTNGLTPDEIGEVLLQSAIYCGVPAANSAFAVAKRVLDEEGQ